MRAINQQKKQKANQIINPNEDKKINKTWNKSQKIQSEN